MKKDEKYNRKIENDAENEYSDQVEGRNAVLELLESDRDINKIYISDGEKHGSINKIIALARINNAPYSIIEHVNDNPLDLRVENLKFSSMEQNIKSAFINGHRNTSSALFRVELFNGDVLEGTLKQIAKQTGISRITLYDRFYNGPREVSNNSRQKVKSVIKIGHDEGKEYLSNRSIDYRKGKFQGKLILDKLTIDFSTK